MYAVMLPSTYTLTEEENETIKSLRDKGCAVTVFLPQEIKNALEDNIENAMTEAGWKYIDQNG